MILAVIASPIARAALVLALAGGLLASAYYLGWANRGAREDARDAESYRRTMEAIEDADVSRGDPVDDLEWLRRRAQP